MKDEKGGSMSCNRVLFKIKAIGRMIFYIITVGFFSTLLGMGMGIDWIPSLVFGLTTFLLVAVSAIRGVQVLPLTGLILGLILGYIFNLVYNSEFGLIYGVAVFLVSASPYCYQKLLFKKQKNFKRAS